MGVLTAAASSMQEEINFLKQKAEEDGAATQDLEARLRAEMNEKLKALQQAADHRYDLQISENTRYVICVERC